MNNYYPLPQQADNWLAENYVAYFIGDVLHAVTWRGDALFCTLDDQEDS